MIFNSYFDITRGYHFLFWFYHPISPRSQCSQCPPPHVSQRIRRKLGTEDRNMTTRGWLKISAPFGLSSDGTESGFFCGPKDPWPISTKYCFKEKCYSCYSYILIGGWYTYPPAIKNSSQIGSSSQLLVKIKDVLWL